MRTYGLRRGGWGSRTGKCLDLIAHDVDTAVVGGVQLQDHLPHVLDAIDAPCQCEDRGGLARAWRTVEKEVWHPLRWSISAGTNGRSKIHTFVAMNLLIVEMTSPWPHTLSSVSGRYFSTLRSERADCGERAKQHTPGQVLIQRSGEVSNDALAGWRQGPVNIHLVCIHGCGRYRSGRRVSGQL